MTKHRTAKKPKAAPAPFVLAERIALTVGETVRATTISRAEIYRLIHRGELVAYKQGKRTMLAASVIQRWLESRPTIVPRNA